MTACFDVWENLVGKVHSDTRFLGTGRYIVSLGPLSTCIYPDLLKCRVPKTMTHALITSREIKASNI